jgi:uric acid-xanthine permease
MGGGGFNRRNRFIVSCAVAIGVGVSVVPQWSTNALWPAPGPDSPAALASVRIAVLLILETGFCIGAIVAFVLNMIFPIEAEPVCRWCYAMLHLCSAASLPQSSL